ncbi:MAG: hypothetical protein HY293_02375 [Planctomycetes bacterium]|nr:hypothetical protein [Planctomycetota bacterium]
MNDSLFYLVLVLGIAAVIAIWYARLRRSSREDAVFHRVAQQLGGKVNRADPLEPLALQFSIEGRPAMIEFEGNPWLRLEGNVPPSTRVKVSMSRRSPGVCRILANHVAREQMKFIGSRDIRIGDSRFDASWFVTARPESLAHRIFSEERREQVIESVRRLGRFSIPSIEITRDALVVRVDRILDREEDVLALAQTAIDFVGYLLRLGPEEGIAWLAGDAAEVGLCPVCAAELAEGVVRCDKCGTPQHEECWKYVGQCSTYACKGKRFVA